MMAILFLFCIILALRVGWALGVSEQKENPQTYKKVYKKEAWDKE